MSSQHRSDYSDKSVNDKNPELAGFVQRNISAIIKMRAEKEREKNLQERAADALTMFSGSMMFVFVHAVCFGLWILFNVGWLGGGTPFDPFPFSLLTLIVSLEAIFLSTFVLISQNHAGQMADKRADLDLQINLLSEHEITRLLTLTDAIADHLGIQVEKKPDNDELKKDVDAKQLLEEIESREKTEK
ncbi:MAG: DUF1003 domain-containing protein, partial [Acidobacteriota bacterium]